jgi:hypothetical protein
MDPTAIGLGLGQRRSIYNETIESGLEGNKLQDYHGVFEKILHFLLKG